MSKGTLNFFKLVTGGLVSLSLCLSVGTASAQTSRRYGPSWELTAFNGYFIAQDLFTVLSGNGGVGTTIGLKNSYMYGGRIGFFPQPNGGVEFAYTRTGSDVEVKNTFAGDLRQNLGRINYSSYDLNFVGRQHNFANPKVTGFGTLGFGWTVTDPQVEDLSGKSLGSSSLFGVNFGLGANVAMSPVLDLRLEGRWKVTGTNITTGSTTYCDIWGYCYGYTSSTYNSGELTVGLTYKLGQK